MYVSLFFNVCVINCEISFFFRVQQLEKDLYYYKKTSRDLRRKVKDLIASGVIPNPGELGLGHWLDLDGLDGHSA